MPHMFQPILISESNPPPPPTPNKDTLKDAALLFAGCVFNSQAHNLQTSDPTCLSLATDLVSMSRVIKRKLEEEDPYEAVPPALRELLQSLENNFTRALGRVEKRLGARLERVEKRLERVEKRLERVENRLERVENRLERVENRLERVENRLERVETALNHQIDHVSTHPLINYPRLEPTPMPGPNTRRSSRLASTSM